MRLIDLDTPNSMPLDFAMRIEVRIYPQFGDPAYTEAIYRIGALLSNARGTYGLALERETEDGRTEVLRIRLLKEDEEYR